MYALLILIQNAKGASIKKLNILDAQELLAFFPEKNF